MEDFYKKFRDNIVNRPEPEGEPRLWERLKNDLDAQERRPLPAYAWRWAAAAAAALLLFMGAATFFYLKLNKAHEMIADNNDLIARMKIQRDTIVEPQFIYKTDTIYKTITKTEKTVEYIAGLTYNNYFETAKNSPSVLIAGQRNIPANIAGNTWPENPHISPIANYWLQKKEKEIEKKRAEFAASESLKKDVEFLEIPAATYLPFANPNLNNYTSHYETLVKNKKKNFRQYIYAMRPKGFVAGVTAGWASSINENLDEHKGYTVGLHTALSFSPNLQLWMDAAFLKTGFSADEISTAYGVPPIPPPSDDFTFTKADVSRSSFEYSVGMKYLLNADGKWKPFVGVGFASLPLLSYSIDYEFRNNITDEDWDTEKEFGKGEINTDFILLRAGVEYEISNNWHLLFKGSYRSSLDNSGLQTPPLVSFQSGLNYSF